MNRTRRAGWAAATVVAALAVAACGGAPPPAPVAEDGTTVTLPQPEPGPVPDLPVHPDSAVASPLPDIAVRQLNGEGGWVQLKDELPSDKPLLVWFWAPH